MDVLILFPVLSIMYSGILQTVASAPTGETPAASSSPAAARHVRTKRCSCATFMDKECVYFCHLDIIWVNTPERIVSYGLGNAPRKRRDTGGEPAMVVPMMMGDSRCKCLRADDNTCTNFCQLENHLRYKASPDKVILSADGDERRRRKHGLAAKTGRIKRSGDDRNPCRLPPRSVPRGTSTCCCWRGGG